MHSLKRPLWTAMLVIVIFPVCGLAEEYRTWTDREGKFSIEAMLLDLDSENVKLKRKSDGKTISIALEKLSLPDQVYVKKTMESLGGGSSAKSQSPFEEVDDESPRSKTTSTPPKTTRSARPEPMEDDDDPPQTLADGVFRGKIPVTRLSSALSIRAERATTTWSAAPDPAKNRSLDFKPNVPNFVYGKQDFFTNVKVEGVCFAENAPEKILTAVSLKFRSESVETKVFFGDMKTGRVFAQKWPYHLKPLGLSPDGTRGLFGQISGRFDKITHLTLTDTTQPKLPCVAVFAPFAEKAERIDSANEIRWADWIDDEHILAQSSRGVIVLMQVKNGAAVWTLDGTSTSNVVLSPGKKYLITRANHDSYYLLETLTGKPIGELAPAEGGKFGFSTKFAFSQDGEQIVVYEGNQLHILEMKSGTAKEPFYIGNRYVANIWWVSDVHVLCGETLVEIVEQLPIWVYSGVNSDDVFFAGRFWHAASTRSNDSSFYVADAVIPHQGMPTLPPLSDEQKYCVRPGMEINLTVDSSIPDSAKLREHIVKELGENGLKVVPEAALTLAVRLTAGKQEEGEWMTGPGAFAGRGSSVGKATYTPYTYSFSFEKDGQTLWTLSSGTGSPSFSVNDLAGNRSIQDVVTEKSKPKSDWYFRVKIPSRIPFDKAGKSVLFRN